MPNQLRQGIERLRQYYIQELVEGGVDKTSDSKLNSMTLSELEKIFGKEFPPKN